MLCNRLHKKLCPNDTYFFSKLKSLFPGEIPFKYQET
jgi:hypothetical protein